MIIQSNYSLKSCNTFGVEATARQLAIITSAADLTQLMDNDRKSYNDLLILGEGSNILFTRDYQGMVLLNRIKGMKVIARAGGLIDLKVNGGENWAALVDYTVQQGWGGIENLSLIPGTVGAAPVQNIGAYGVELQDVLIEVEAFDLQNRTTRHFTRSKCSFDYRNSIFKSKHKGRFFILSVTMRLHEVPELILSYAPLKKKFEGRDEKTILVQEVSEAVKEIRNSKLPDPAMLGNAGSFFKNPVVPFSKIESIITIFPDMPFYKVDEDHYKIAAGWLIEQAGWKGKRIGDAGVHEKQALVLVNYGKASGEDIFRLSEKVQTSVFERFGVKLEREVTVL